MAVFLMIACLVLATNTLPFNGNGFIESIMNAFFL